MSDLGPGSEFLKDFLPHYHGAFAGLGLLLSGCLVGRCFWCVDHMSFGIICFSLLWR